MSRNLIRCLVIAIVLPVCFLSPNRLFAQNSFENAAKQGLDSLLNSSNAVTTIQTEELGPDDALQGVMTPSGWGGSGTSIFGGLGGDYPQPYKHTVDLIASGGFCVGDAQKAVNLAVSLNMTDVHRFKDFSGNFILSRELSPGNSISAGGLQVFASASDGSDSPNPTFFAAFSHAVQWAPSKTPGCSALSYTIGIGNGRFLYKSPEDILNGKGKYATGVFGTVSYEVITHVNLNAEWYGENLGLSAGIRPFDNPLSFGIGIDNLTRYTGDKSSMIFTIGYPLSLMR